MESTTARARRIVNDIAAVTLILFALALVVIGALALAGAFGPGCQR
jgi:hypothetical protein